jgi:cell division transport system ATP-binding protein
MIKFKNISKIYPINSEHTVALENVSFVIHPKEFVAIAGQSGAGKTTLLRLLLKEEAPTRGDVIVDGQNLDSIRYKDLPCYRRKIGAVFQDFKLISNKTAYENIAFAMEAAGKTDEEIEKDIPEILKLIGLSERTHHFPSQLSGGEKQRIAIGRALAHRPVILVADEPTGNLDPLHTWDIVRLLCRINEMGTTVILATHDREVINTIGKRVITLDKGRLIRDEEKGRYLA